MHVRAHGYIKGDKLGVLTHESRMQFIGGGKLSLTTMMFFHWGGGGGDRVTWP